MSLNIDEQKEYDALMENEKNLQVSELARVVYLEEKMGRKADKNGGETARVKQGSSDTDDEQKPDQDIGGATGQEQTHEQQQKNLNIGQKASNNADGGKKRKADKEGGEVDRIGQGSSEPTEGKQNSLTAKKRSQDKDGGEKVIILQGASRMRNEDVNLDNGLKNLLSSEGLSEELKEKFATIFTTAVVDLVNQKIDEMKDIYQDKLAHEIDILESNLSEGIDKYTSFLSNKWLEENKVAIEQSLQMEVATSFIKNMKENFEIHNIEIPDCKVDLLDQTQEKLNEANEKLDKISKDNMEKIDEISRLSKSIAIDRLAENMTAIQKDNLTRLSEGLEYKNAEEFESKLKIVKETYFKDGNFTTSLNENTQHVESAEQLLEESNTKPANDSPEMNMYLNFADKLDKSTNKILK